ncbi:IclR family transcriptional regulator [uncultured Sphaerochaeta sp.]|uniref:IclR family transcriptional regulator n=1 Tax=uncultured Sphaerochaeta sp. TaxID=886478 RepID=UPI002A0A496D|nr:IclR family transcriptional regulator [uncultured Sphaerochaeta sp.]
MVKKESEVLGDKQLTSGVVRTIAILETLSRSQNINLESLSKETKLPKATLLRFLSTLVSLGYVYRDPADLYSLTLKMFSIGSHGLEHIDLINVAQPVAQKLCTQLGETVHMGVLEENYAVYVLKKESSFTIRMYSRVGKSIPLYCTAIGKVLLSDMSDAEVDDYLSKIPLKPFTPNTIREPEALKRELGEIRSLGWASDNEEHEIGTLCIGAPIRDYTGKVIAAMSVSWPLFRFNHEEKELIVHSILTECNKLSGLLGWQRH